jgi:uncharacterized protein (TIGR03435 family)
MAAMRSGFFVVLFALLCAGICAQQPTAKSATQAAYMPSMTFDVASIRESKPGDTITVSGIDPAHNSLVKLSNYDVSNLLAVAYGVHDAQIVGLPGWVSHLGPFFDVEARSDTSADERLAKLSDEQAKLEKEHMFQMLLADRFQLKVHWETREGPIYELVVAKNGPKLHSGGSLPPSREELDSWGDRKIPPIYQRGSSLSGFDLIGHQCSIESLAGMLTGQMGAPVVDKTGLTGTYDFDLKYLGPTEHYASEDPSIPRPLTEALPDQLGLKLQSAKGEKQFLVIDHIERPSAN